MDLVLYKLGREANTRRPTLPPSALILDDKTTAAIKKRPQLYIYNQIRHLKLTVGNIRNTTFVRPRSCNRNG